MRQKYLEFVVKPAEKEYFTRFIGIYSRDKSGMSMETELVQDPPDDKKIVEYCDKVRVGETLEEAVRRSMADDFGLKASSIMPLPSILDTAKNKFGDSVFRIGVIVYVEFKKLAELKVLGFEVKWKEREDEALNWLLRSKHLFPLAGNRFANKQESIDFVKKLYEAGAVDVTLDLSEINEDAEGAYTDTLYVRAPKDPDARKKLLEIYNEEIQKEMPGEAEVTDMGQENLTFWWD